MSVQNQIPKTSIFGALRALNLLFLSFPSVFEKCLLNSVFWTSENERCVYLSQCLLKSFITVPNLDSVQISMVLCFSENSVYRHHSVKWSIIFSFEVPKKSKFSSIKLRKIIMVNNHFGEFWTYHFPETLVRLFQMNVKNWSLFEKQKLGNLCIADFGSKPCFEAYMLSLTVRGCDQWTRTEQISDVRKAEAAK